LEEQVRLRKNALVLIVLVSMAALLPTSVDAQQATAPNPRQLPVCALMATTGTAMVAVYDFAFKAVVDEPKAKVAEAECNAMQQSGTMAVLSEPPDGYLPMCWIGDPRGVYVWVWDTGAGSNGNDICNSFGYLWGA
jgi:hypothetical protein